ncbi:MAG: XisI protein, partial [Bacteroidota bacterium]
TDIKYANLDASNFLIADKENRRYQVVTMGWDKDVFIHDCPIHLDIINDKIWIQQNNTELDLAEILVEKGVDRSEIVLGFLSPKLREYTDYAVV